MDLGRGPHCAFAFEGVVIFGLQEIPAECVNGPFLVKSERTSSEAFGAYVLCGESLPHVRRHASFAIAPSRSAWAEEKPPRLLGGQSMSRGEFLATIMARWSGGN
jgi:hypothetical protein